ncbi:hypothetical protein GCM10010289_75410 [Streptomyces violascens]|nr:hypothetical protein GCM10010289_75410 [Streptomyces violascens]
MREPSNCLQNPAQYRTIRRRAPARALPYIPLSLPIPRVYSAAPTPVRHPAGDPLLT